jgi:hypothetical protein
MQNPNQDNQAEEDILNKAANQLFRGQTLDFSHLASRDANIESDMVSEAEMSNDDIYDFIRDNRDRSFDKTTAEGRLLFARFEEANSRRNKFTFETIKQMAGIVSSVPFDIAAGVARNVGVGKDGEFAPQRIVGSVVDGVLRDARDLAGLLTQSEDPDSLLFRFRNLITGSGSIESRIDQFNEARWWGNRSNDLEEGKADILSEWVPDDYKEFAKKLVDPKLANALSYIGLDTIPFIKSRFARQGLKDSVRAYKGIDELYSVSGEEALQTRDWFSTTAEKFGKLSQKLTGEGLVAGSNIVSTPISYIQQKISRGSDVLEHRVGYVPPEVANGASTLLTEAGPSLTKEGLELGPIRSVLFSFGLKPISEYAGVLGNEMIDAYQGVVKPKSEHLGAGMLQRLALNGGRISMSKEAQAVAKFTNVVVGWPASMAFPALKRAVGDAAYMGLLGYANARGEGAAGGVGVGFAWGGLSGSLRHLHNVHTQGVAHKYIIDNFDSYQIQAIAKSSPDHANHVGEFLKRIDSIGNQRVSATVRAQIMMGWNVNAQTQLRFADLNGLASEFGPDVLAANGLLEEGAMSSKGALIHTPKGDVVWVNKGVATTPEAAVHEYGHVFLDSILQKTDGTAVDALKSFLGFKKDGGVAPDKVLALWIAHYSQRRFGMDKKSQNWLMGPAQMAQGETGSIAAFGNYQYALQQINAAREFIATNPNEVYEMYKDKNGVMRLRMFDQFPIIERLMQETFAYNQSNSLLVRAPDIFLRNKDLGLIRGAMENWFTLRNQRTVADLETAGVLVREKLKNSEEVGMDGRRGATVLENMFWEDGTYLSFPMLDKWVGEQMKRALKYGDVNITTLTGDRAEAWSRQTGKTRFFEGGKIKTKKEIEEIVTQTSNEVANILDSLPDDAKPKWDITKGGNRRVSLTSLSQQAWEAIRDSGTYTKEEYQALVTMVEVLKQIDAGKPVFNTYYGQYLGVSQQIVEAALGERLKGRQVAVTNRHFAPFNIELIVSKFDEAGNPLRTPKSHITIHAHDVSVLNKRKMNQWNKPEVRALFKDFGHFSETFVEWFENHSRDASTRKTSADLLRPAFGDKAERVRDIMYETWGGRKRNDESYINAPEGYAGGRDGPLYPIHSLRFDLLANIQRQSQIFPEAFSGQVMGLFYKEGVGYEPMRRNMMLGNFTERELANGRRFYTNGSGYEIRGEMPKFKVFNPYGNLVGVFKTIEKAQAAADKDSSKRDVAESSPSREDLGDAPIVENYDNPSITPAQVYSGIANLCIYEGGYLPFKISKSARGNAGSALTNFVTELSAYNKAVFPSVGPVDPENIYRRFDKLPVVKLHTLIENPDEWRKALGPEYFDRIEVAYDPRADFHGGVVIGLSAGRTGGTMFGVDADTFSTENSIESASVKIRAHLQGLISFKEKSQTMVRTGLSMMDTDFQMMHQTGRMLGFLHAEYKAQNPNGPLTQKAFEDWNESQVTQLIQEKSIELAINPKVNPRRSIPFPIKGDFSKPYKGGLIPRYAQALFDSLESGAVSVGITPITTDNPRVAESLNNWMCDIVEEYLSGRAQATIFGNNFIVTIDPVKWDIPQDVRAYFNKYSTGGDPNGGHYWKRLTRFVQNQFLTHAFSKMGNRNVAGKFDIAGNSEFMLENISISKLNEGAYPTAFENFGPDGGFQFPIAVEFGAKYPSVSSQMANMVAGTKSGRALFLVSPITGNATKVVGKYSKFVVASTNLTVMGYSGFDASGRGSFLPATPTTEPSVGLNDIPYFDGKNGQLGLVEAPVDLEANMLGVLPFSGVTGKGSLFKHFSEKWHIDHVEYLAGQLSIPFDRQKDGTSVGLLRWQKSLFQMGLKDASHVYLHQAAVGAMQAEIGASIMSDPNDAHFNQLVAMTDIDPSAINKAEYGQAIANKGYASIIHAAQNASLDSIGSKYKRKGSKRPAEIGSVNSIIEGSFKTSDKPSKREQLTKGFVREIRKIMGELEAAGYDPHRKVIRGMERRSDLMLGGFMNSTAKEREMLETGAMRLVKTDSGKTYKAFEFSDKDAFLLLEKVGGKMHLLPFMEDGDKGFETFIRNTELGLNAVFLDSNSVKLSDILDHKLLYLHYPSLKNVMVQWKEGYGADYNPDSDVIRLGIDTFIGEELAGRRNKDYLTHALFGHDGQRHATETLLHEIQHAIQMREMWSDSYALTGGSFGTAGRIMSANIAGVSGRTIAEAGEGRAINNDGVEFYTGDGKTPTDFSPQDTLNSIYRLGNTPMHKHLRQIAYPAFVRVSNEAINALTDAHIHHPPEHPARRNAQSAVKSLVAMRDEAKALTERFKKGELSEEAFRSLMCDTDNGLAIKFIKRIQQVRNAMYLDASPMAEKLYNTMGNAEKYLHRSLEALNGFEAIAKMAERDGLNGDVVLASTKLKQVFNNLAGMHYLSQRIEVEANLTEQRSRMTQAELNSTGLNPDGSRKSLLDGMTGALDIGYKGNTLRNIGIALKNKQRIRVADLMLGGVASKDPARSVNNNDVISMMARGSLITWTVRQLRNELDALDRVAVIGRGWEVAEDGSVKLVAKTATVQLDSKKPRKKFKEVGESIKGGIPMSGVQSGDIYLSLDENDRVHVTNAIWGSGERTVTIEDIARLIDGVVLNEWEVRTPTEVMDTVLRDDFPAVVKISELRDILIERGVSEDGFALANIEAFYKEGNGKSHLYGPLELTKYELADVLSVFHRQYINERIVSVSEGVKKFGEVDLDRDSLSPSKIIESIVAQGRDDPNVEDPLRSFLLQRVGAVFDLADANTDRLPFAQGDKRIGITSYDANQELRRTTANLNPFNRPDWMSSEDYDAIVKRLESKGHFRQGKLFDATTLANTSLGVRNNMKAEQIVRETNMRIRRKMFLLKPFYEKVIGVIDKAADPDARKIKIKLLDEIAKTLIEPELEGMREYTSSSSVMNTQSVQPYTQDAFERNADFTKSPTARFGMTLSLVGSGNAAFGDTGFIELQTLQTAVGPTAVLGRDDMTYLTGGMKPADIYNVNTWDNSAIRYLYRDNRAAPPTGAQHTFEHLNSIVTSTRNLVAVTREIIAHAEMGLGEGTTGNADILNKMRLMHDMAVRLSLVEERTTSLIGDNKESNSDQPSRNVISSQSYIDGMAPLIAQESFLMKGYAGNDGSVVIGETKLANTVAAVQLDGVTSMPFFDGSGLPSVAANPNFVKNAVSGLIARDMAVRTVLFGEITDGQDVQGPLSHISPISTFVEGFRTGDNASVKLDTIAAGNETTATRTTLNGLHALHSILYTATMRAGKQVELSGVLGSDKTFYETWGVNWNTLRTGVGDVSEISSASYVPAMAPLLAAAFSPKQLGIRKGRMTVVDHLLPEQRQLLKNAREAYKDFSMDTGATPTPEQKAAANAFFESISESQHRLMFGHLDTANAEITFTALCSAYEALSMIQRLPESPNMDAMLGRRTKEVLAEEIGKYISEGRYMYEQGNSEGPVARSRFANGNVGRLWMQVMYKSVMIDETNRHMLMGVWSLMDQHSKGYRSEMMVEEGARQNYPMYYRNGYKPELLRDRAGVPFASMKTKYAKRQFSGIGPEHGISDFDNATTVSPSFSHSLASAFETGDGWNDHYVLQPTDVGLAESLFNPIDIEKTNSEIVAIDEGPSQQAPDAIMGASRIDVAMRGSPISNKLTRKQMVDSIITQAKRNKTDAISLEPARMRLSGRLVSNAIQRGWEGENVNSSEGLGFRAHAYGVTNNLFGPFMFFTKNEVVSSVSQTMAPSRVGLTEPMRGFAWKRLEDGSLVLNISGDITGYKAGYLGNQIRATAPNPKTKLGAGFSIRESLGYDPRSGEISNANPYVTLFGLQTSAIGGGGAVGLQNYFRIGGEPWRKQIVSSARNRLKKGDSIRSLYEGAAQNREGIRNVSGYINFNALEVLMTSDNAHNDKDVIALALAINGHKTGAQHITLTFRPEEANPDYIKSVLMAIMVMGAGAEMTNSIWNKTYERQGSTMNPFLGDGERIIELLSNKNSFNMLKGENTRLMQIMGERVMEATASKDALEINDITGFAAGQGVSESGRSPSESRNFFAKFASQTLSRSQDVIPDIERIAAAAVGADHGYILPDAERHLAKNGDTTVSIEHMFPNRPELTQFAWDGKESNGVSIVHRGPKTKPTGYFVTYDIQTGVNDNGDPIMSRKVVPVKTLVEAEALRNKYGVSASKAILAQALVSAGAGEASIKEGVMKSDDNIDVSVRANKHLDASSRQDGTLNLVNDGTFTVGDLDLNISKAEATALSAALGSRAVLQTKLPAIEVGRANLMIGDSNARELEGMLRRKINFGFGQGPVEFASKMMRVVAYGRKKSGKDKYPDSMTGLDWFKFLKESSVSKDEIRMSGIAYLLHDNMNTHLTRKDLAEFIYTVYPRTSRQARTSQINISADVHKVKTGSLSGIYEMPYLEDLQTKEDFVINTHLANLESVAAIIEKALTDETTRADAEALRANIMKSIEFTVAEMGAPEGLAGLTDLTTAINYLRNVYQEGRNQMAYTHAGFAGETRKVRPAILEFVMAESVFGRTSDQYKAIETVLGDAGLINPYSIIHSDVSGMANPFGAMSVSSGNRANTATSLNEGVGPMKRDYDSTDFVYPSYQSQNFYYHAGNYHSSWASFTGYYQSNPIYTEFYNKRILKEKDAAIKTLKERIKGTKDPATKAKYESIISNINRVYTVREMIKNGHALHDYGHYSDNDIGTFQIGHVRTTQTILSGEYGFGDPKTPNYHVEEVTGTYGYQFNPEVVLAIEEIQSDSFQYHSFGPPSAAEKALPDSLEQVEGFKRAGDMAALLQSREKLTSIMSSVGSLIGTQVQKMSYNGFGDVELNSLFGVKLLDSLSPVERFMLREDLALVDSGRTIEVPEALRKYTGNMQRIPVFVFPEMSKYKDTDYTRTEGYNPEAASKVINDLVWAAGDSVLDKLLPDRVSSSNIRSAFENLSQSYNSASKAITPSLIFALAAMADEEVIAKSIEIANSERDMLPYKGINWDAVARRTLDKLKQKRTEVLSGETPEAYSRYAKIRFFDTLMDTYEEWISSPQNRSAVVLLSDAGNWREWEFTGSSEYNDYQKHIVANGGDFRAITQPHGYKGGIGARVFPPTHSLIKDAQFHKGRKPNTISGVRSYEMGTNEFEGMGTNHNMQYRVGSTALGTVVANSVQPLMTIMAAAADAPERLKQVEKDIAELAKVLPVVPTGRDPAILNTLPFGVEDVYKPISLNGTVMRAANAGLSAITYADARHQVNRGHSMDASSAMLVGRQANIMYLGQDGPNSHMLSYLNMLPDWLTYQLHDGFMKRMADFSQQEFMTYFRGRQTFEHGGINAPYNVHLLLTLKAAIPHLFTEGISIDDVKSGEGLRDVWKALAAGNIDSIKDEVMFGDYSFKEDSSLIGPDGKPYKPRDLSTNFMQRFYGKQVIGEKKSGNQRTIDNGLANIGRYHFWFERGDAMGYVSQYGAPSWFMESIMWGQTKKNQGKFSTDAFIRPNAVLREDGTWTIINPKTGQAIMEKISNMGLLKEAMLQNSEYTGSLPYIGQFVKQWGPVGGYVTQGHSNGQVTGTDNIDWSQSFGFAEGALDPVSQRRRQPYRSQAAGLIGQDFFSSQGAGTGGSTFSNVPSKPMSPTGHLATQLGYKIWFKHVMKVDTNDVQAVSNALTTIATSGGPVLRFKPKFPNEAHKAAFRKKIVEGIALLMPADGGLGKPKADTATLETLSRMYNWFSKATGGRKIPTQGEALEDEDESRP